MKEFNLNNGWFITMYKENSVYFNEKSVTVVDHDNNLIALIQFEEDKIDFLYTNLTRLLLNKKTITP